MMPDRLANVCLAADATRGRLFPSAGATHRQPAPRLGQHAPFGAGQGAFGEGLAFGGAVLGRRLRTADLWQEGHSGSA